MNKIIYEERGNTSKAEVIKADDQLVSSLTHSHTPFKFSFHSETFPSPQLTARMLPAKLQDTRQTTSGNFPGAALGVAAAGAPVVADVPSDEGSKGVLTQGFSGESFVHMRTVRSCDAVAKYARGRPIFGAHATSRTQSVWPASVSSSAQHRFVSL